MKVEEFEALLRSYIAKYNRENNTRYDVLDTFSRRYDYYSYEVNVKSGTLDVKWNRDSYCHGIEEGSYSIPLDGFEFDLNEAYRIKRSHDLSDKIYELQNRIKEIGRELIDARKELKRLEK